MTAINFLIWLKSLKRTQVVFGLMAIGFLCMGIYSFALRYELHTERTEHELKIVKITATLNQVTLERDEYKRSFEQLQKDITAANKANAEAFKAAQKENISAMERLRADQIKADKNQTEKIKVIKSNKMCEDYMKLADTYCPIKDL